MAEWELGPRVREPWAEEEGPERACLELAVAVSAEPVSRERASAAAAVERLVRTSARRAGAREPAVRLAQKVAKAWPESPVLRAVAVVVVPWRLRAEEAEWGCPSGAACSKRGLRAEEEAAWPKLAAGGRPRVPLPGWAEAGLPVPVCSVQGAAAESAGRLLPERVPAVALGAVGLHPVPVVEESVWLPAAGEQAVLAHAAPRCCGPWIRETLMSR